MCNFTVFHNVESGKVEDSYFFQEMNINII